MEKGKILLGLSLALIGYTFSTAGFWQIGLIVVIGVTGHPKGATEGRVKIRHW